MTLIKQHGGRVSIGQRNANKKGLLGRYQNSLKKIMNAVFPNDNWEYELFGLKSSSQQVKLCYKLY